MVPMKRISRPFQAFPWTISIRLGPTTFILRYQKSQTNHKPQTHKPATGAFAPYTSQHVLNLCVQVWLVQATMPLVTVDLGVDYGYSTFCFALPVIGEVCVRASKVQHQIGV
jgi:hypothetical protein